jgi:hypothetical protein
MPRRGGELGRSDVEQRDDLSILSRELMTWVRDVGAGDLEEEPLRLGARSVLARGRNSWRGW